jgi:hypothetical protein
MPLYVCRFCDYNSKEKKTYYNHLYTHINENNASFDKEELELCNFYYNKKTQIGQKYRQNNKEYRKEYYQNNKDKICQRQKKYRLDNKDRISQYDKEYCENNKERIYQRGKEYYQNNKDKISKRCKIKMKEYRQNNKDRICKRLEEYHLRKKLEKEEANILDVYDSD